LKFFFIGGVQVNYALWGFGFLYLALEFLQFLIFTALLCTKFCNPIRIALRPNTDTFQHGRNFENTKFLNHLIS